MAGIYLSRELGWTESRVKTSSYRAVNLNPVSIEGWLLGPQILLLNLLSFLAMTGFFLTATLLSFNLWSVSLSCDDVALLECSFDQVLKGRVSSTN